MKRILSLSVCLMLMLVLFSGCDVHWDSYVYRNADRYSSGDAVIDGKVEKIVLDWLAGDILITSGKGSSVELSETSSRELTSETSLHYWLEGTTLHVKFAASGQWKSWVRLEKSLIVTLPANAVPGAVAITTASAGVTMESVTVPTLAVKTVSGEIKATIGGADRLTAETVSGEVQLETEGKIGALTVMTVSGDIVAIAAGMDDCTITSVSGRADVEADQLSACCVQTTSGRIRVTLPDNHGFSAELVTTSGDISCDFAAEQTEKKFVYQGDGNLTGTFALTSVSGNLQLIKK